MLNPKITIKLMGGLGNQMFQYALGRSLSLKYQIPLWANVDFYKNDKVFKRSFLLDKFNTKIDKLFGAEEKGHRLNNNKYYRFIRSKFIHTIYEPVIYSDRGKYIEQFNQGRPVRKLESSLGHIKTYKSIELIGYWQSYRYFDTIRETLLDDFVLKETIATEKRELLKKIINSNSVCLGIRQYNESKEANIYFKQSKKYYDQAISIIKKKIKTPKLFVFTVDKEWCVKNIDTDLPLTIVPWLEGKSNTVEDMYLMSQCRHFIIPNSTYHWWGAWLSQSQNKIVIAPESGWSNEKTIPDTWMKI